MPRPSRNFIPGDIYHITHRCHKKDFLLKFLRDRKRYQYWLFEAKNRYGFSVLNYMVTSNHIHLLVQETKVKSIEKSIQLIASRTAQEYNIRKKRNGAFWQDRYHATTIEKSSHLWHCYIYIDLNMIRTGTIKTIKEWHASSYTELRNQKQRYNIVNKKELLNIFESSNINDFIYVIDNLLQNKLNHKGDIKRESIWTEQLAVGSEHFIQEQQQILLKY